jgi:type II secretory pathway pseudopilin PulG
LLVVIAVLGAAAMVVAVGLLQARESARRASCAGNLRQLGLALQSYHQAFGMLPPAAVRTAAGAVVKLGNRTSGGEDYSLYTSTANWAVLLLPHLGEEALAQRFYPAALITDEGSAEARGAELSVMTCPADSFHRASNQYCARVAEAMGERGRKGEGEKGRKGEEERGRTARRSLSRSERSTGSILRAWELRDQWRRVGRLRIARNAVEAGAERVPSGPFRRRRALD